MGDVFRVRDDEGREVALKLLRADSRSRDLVVLFRREYHTLVQLRHPAIVEVHDFGVDADGPYYTMELLRGRDLRDLAPLPVVDACRVLRDVASALAFLHARKLIHRDVAPRNVRCSEAVTAAKLIDFGALATSGATASVIGTPPFVPPEALRGLPLDHRVDLFGLGALAYWALSGRNAYPTRRLGELEELWRHRPPGLAEIAPDIPAALDELVMALLSLDPRARPASAAEVIDALTAVAALPRAAPREEETARGYLASVGTVGRGAELAQLEVRLARALAGTGCAMTIEAPAGLGKSRLLREIALQIQLRGVTVLVVDAAAGGRAPHATIGELARELFARAPVAASSSAARHAAFLSALVPALHDRLGAEQLTSSGDALEDRARARAAITAWFLDVAAIQPLALVVDDVHECDEGSVAILAGLAHAAVHHRLLLVLGLRTGAPAPAAEVLASLRDASARTRLRGLSAADTQTLVRELFGDVPNVVVLAAWMHATTDGTPLQVIELARHLVDRGIVRYADGIWIIPDVAEGAELPQSFAAATMARLDHLGADARRLAEVIAVHGGPLALAPAVALSGDADDVVFAALDELVREELLVQADDAYRFRHDGVRAALVAGLAAPRRRELHLRIGAALLAGLDDDDHVGAAAAGRHLHAGGEVLRGAKLLEGAGRGLLEAQAFAEAIPALQTALDVYEAVGHAPAACSDMRALLMRAALWGDPSLASRYGEQTLALLGTYSGIARAARLGRYLGRRAALVAGLASAGVRRWLTRADRRPPPAKHALRQLIESAFCAAAIANRRNDVATVERVLELVRPALLGSISALHMFYRLTQILSDNRRGRLGDACARARENIAILTTRPPAGLRPSDAKAMLAASYQQLAAVCAMRGDAGFRPFVEQMDRVGLHTWSSWAPLIAALYHAMRGEVGAAQACKLEAETRAVQSGNWWMGTAWYPVECAAAYGLTDDVIGLKRTIAQLERMAEAGYCLAQNVAIARGDYHRARGELEASRAHFLHALELGPAGEGLYRPHAYAGLVETLVALGEHGRAVALAEEGAAHCRAPSRGHLLAALRIGRGHAWAEAGTGDLAAAAARLDTLAHEAHELGNPAIAGLIDESRARIALRTGDHEAWRTHRAAAERWLRPTDNPVLLRACDRLLALDAEAPTSPPAKEATAFKRPASVTEMLAACRDRSERASRALELLLAETDATAGYLFAVAPHGLELLAPMHGDEPPDALVAALRRVVEQATRVAVVDDVTATAEPTSVAAWEIERGGTRTRWRGILLRPPVGLAIAGAAALAEGPGPWRAPDPALVDSVAAGLVELVSG